MKKISKKLRTLKTFSVLFSAALLLHQQSPAYAADAFESLYGATERPDFSRGAVSIYDVENWNWEYTMGNEIFDAYEKYFSEKAVPMLTTTDSENMYYAVIDENGDYAYRIWPNIASMSSPVKGIYLQSCITLDYVDLRSSVEKAAQFWASESIFKNKIRKRQAYILEHLNDTEYGGISYDMFNGKANLKVYIYLVNEARRAELEAEGFECVSVSYSLAEQYQVIEELWSRKEELGIFDIQTGNDRGLIIYGTEGAEAFYEKAGSALSVPYQYRRGAWSLFGSDGIEKDEDEAYISDEMKLSIAECAGLDLEKPEEFISYIQKMDKTWTDLVDEADWQRLSAAIAEFKQAYPEYSCRNIYYHLAGDSNVSEYMNFEPELLAFADTLSDYKADKNAVIEDIYGDPQRLELKRLLRQYKKMQPEMSYQELYDTYIKGVEEDVLRSKEEKLYWYLWRKYSGTMEICYLEQEVPETTKAPTYDFLPAGNCFVQLDAVYELIDMCVQNPKLTITSQEVQKTLKTQVQKYGSFPSKDLIYSVDVIGEDGSVDYLCGSSSPLAFSAVGNGSLLLYSRWTNEEISLNRPKGEIKNFIKRTNEIAAQVKEKMLFVRNHLEDDEYSGMYSDSEGNVYVMLADEKKASVLEEAGILWSDTKNTKSQVYERIQYLWKNREYLNIKNVQMHTDDDTILIRGYDTKEEFDKKLDNERFWKDYYSCEDRYDTLEEFLTAQIEGYSLDGSQIARLKACMERLAGEYTEYSYENLFSLVFQNAGYEDFLKFDKEIEKFADSLVYYANEKDPFDEEAYGDPEKLLLKVILQKYKEIYPKKSCQGLYDMYVKEIAESKILSQQEKRSKYLWEIVKARQTKAEQLKAKQQNGDAQESKITYAAAGFGFLIAGCIAVIMIKRIAEKKAV